MREPDDLGQWGFSGQSPEPGRECKPPAKPADLSLTPEAAGILVQFSTSVDNGGCDIKSFTVEVNGKYKKTEKVHQPHGYQKYGMAYVQNQAEYRVRVSIENADGFSSEWAEERLLLAKPSTPGELTLTPEAGGIAVQFSTSDEGGGQEIKRFTVTVNGDIKKREKVRQPYGYHKCSIDYVQNQTEYVIQVSVENTVGLSSEWKGAKLLIDRPTTPTDLKLTAEQKVINVTFNAHTAAGHCPLKNCKIYVIKEDGTLDESKLKLDPSLETHHHTIKYLKKLSDYTISVSVENAAGFESTKMSENLRLRAPKRFTTDLVTACVSVVTTVVSLESGIENGCPLGKVEWKKRKSGFKVSLPQKGEKYRYDRSESGIESLIIRSTRYEDDGRYYCEVSNHLGSATSEVHLCIEGPPELKCETPSISEVHYQGPLLLTVAVTANPSPTHQWTLNGEVVENEVSPEITKNHVVEEDAGVYVLTARNEHGLQSVQFLVKVIRNLGFVISGISEEEGLMQKVEEYNDITREGVKNWYPVKLVPVSYKNEELGITSEKQIEEEGTKNERLSAYDMAYRDYSFAARHYVADGIGGLIGKLKVDSRGQKSEYITDTYSFMGIGGGGGILRDFLELGGHISALGQGRNVVAATLQSIIQLEGNKIKPTFEKIANYEMLKLLRPEEEPKPFDERIMLKEFLELIMGREVTESSGILITGFYKQRNEEALQMLINSLEYRDHVSKFTCAPLTKAADFDKWGQSEISKVIIVATFTERMNLLHEGVDAGQVTDVFYKARDNDKKILLLCLGLPKSEYKMDKSQAKYFHEPLSRLFRAQTLLRGLAEDDRFISLLSGSTFDSDQVEAMNKFLHPIKLKKPSSWTSFFTNKFA